ncbi:MAG: hypothetical protein AABZ55_00485 [Bdellovibrionota bacterium]
MKNLKLTSLKPLWISIGTAAVMGAATHAFALDNIVRPWQSVRSSAMGGVKLTTGLYDDNFFGNPARVTQNPKWKANVVPVLDQTIEVNSGAISRIGDIAGGGDVLSKLADSAGSNNHVRIQQTWPSVHIPPKGEDGVMGWSIGFPASVQADIDLRRSFQLDPPVYYDIGAAVTAGRKIPLEGGELSVGLTTHFMGRLATKEGFSLVDLIKGTSFSPSTSGGAGAGVDFDLGGYYKLPIQIMDFDLSGALAINNILGGRFPIKIGSSLGTPRAQPRTFGFGGAARRATLGPFSDFVLALEFTDIGNNPNGSIFRTIHIGSEAKYGNLMGRAGINQGYMTLGLGFDFKFFIFELATYGEEMSLNAGGLEDRRYAVHIGFQI